MKKSIILGLTILTFIGFANDLTAQSNKKKQTKIVEVMGKNTNGKPSGEIINDMKTTDDEIKSSSTKRGYCDCTVKVDNFTSADIKVYVDGNFKGILSAYQESYRLCAYSGYTTVYCVSTGGSYEWTFKGSCHSDYYLKLKYSNAD